MCKRMGFVICILSLASVRVWADEIKPMPNVGSDSEWSKGVSKEDRLKADEFFRRGNKQYDQGLYLLASESYADALKHWNHPGLHLNYALSLVLLDHPLEAREHMIEAVKSGREGLGTRYEPVLRHIAKTEREELTRIVIDCSVPGAKVTIDGKTVFMAPGHYDGFQYPGPHSIIASKDNYLDNSKASGVFAAGKTASFNLQLATVEEMTGAVRKWPEWKTWLPIESGAALVLVGGALHYFGAQKIHDSDKKVLADRSALPNSEIANQRSQGAAMQKTAMVFYSVGGAAIVAGSVWVGLNRPKPIFKEYKVEITPVFGGDTRGALATIHF